MTLDQFYLQFIPADCSVQSVPLKPPSFKVRASTPHSHYRTPTVRSLAALAAAAAASRLSMKAGELIPRRLPDPRGVIENGAARDILGSGVAELEMVNGQEFFRLTNDGANAALRMLDQATLARYGLA